MLLHLGIYRTPFATFVALLALLGGGLGDGRASAQDAVAPAGEQACCSGGDVCSLVECWQPCWYVQAEALALRLNAHAADPLALNVTTGAAVLTAHDLSFPYQTGPRITIGRTLQSGGSIQASYFGLMQWSSRATAVDPNNLRLPGDLGLAGDDFFGADSITVSRQTQLHNVEFNLLKPVENSNLSWLAGLRYVNFSEQVNLHSVDSDGQESDYRTTATNNLIGGQVGGRYDLTWDRLTVTALGKAGVFGAAQNASTFVGDFGNTVVLRDLSVSRGGGAFVGEVGLNGAYVINDWLSVRGGYNVFFLSGIARGTDQFDFTDTPASSTTLAGGGHALLHGFNGGLEVIW